jgi:DNA polymerase III, beta subunit (EC 2.7.7.7)
MELTDGTLSLTASDSETTLSTSLEVNESDGDGRFAVSSKTILEALKEITRTTTDFPGKYRESGNHRTISEW